MAVASNPLLQIGTSVAASGKAQTTAVSSLSKAADTTKDGGSSFAEVYAQEHKALPQKTSLSATARSGAHVATTDKKPAVTTQAKDDKPSVADGGKDSPVARADKPGKADKTDKADKSAKADKADKTDKTDDRDTVQADAAADDAVAVSDKATDDSASDDAADASLAAAAQPADPVATQPAAAPVALDPTQLAQPVVDPAQLQTGVQAQAPSANEDFDPAADALADLPMVRMALEQSAKAQGTTSVHAQAQTSDAQAAPDPTASASFAESMSAMVEKQNLSDAGSSDDSDALGAIGDVTAAAGADGSDSRTDALTSQLSQLNQAVAGKSANAATPLAQPLNMQQTGWSEGLVNKVMYLSSQNLKSADIQLHPLELGRLDIRVDVTPDQSTQITFHSAHLGVRDALESQQGRLRDMLAQQGMSQVDVNVSDQSRQSQQQQQQNAQAQASQNSGGQGRRGGNAAQDSEGSSIAEAAATQTVIGSSLVDYYA